MLDHASFSLWRLRLPPCRALCVPSRPDGRRTGYAPWVLWFAAGRGGDVHAGARDGSPLATTLWPAQPIEPAQPAMGRQDAGHRPAPFTHRLARRQVDRAVHERLHRAQRAIHPSLPRLGESRLCSDLDGPQSRHPAREGSSSTSCTQRSGCCAGTLTATR